MPSSQERKNQKQKYYRQGKFSEKLSAWFLRMKGYRVLQQNYKTRLGEIDIIALKKNTLCFVEVKKRSSLDEASNAISYQQKERIIRAAQLFTQQSQTHQKCDIRFDAILIGATVFPYHIKNAWQTD